MRFVAFIFAFVALQGWAAEKPKIVFVAGEYEYLSRETLPKFAEELGKTKDAAIVVLSRPEDPKQQTIPALDRLKDANLLVLFVRRMTLPEHEVKFFRDYVDAGKPLVALRTSSHAFENWKEFDKDVLGGNYQGHHGAKLKTTVSFVAEAKDHPLLRGVSSFVSEGSLYKNAPLQPGTKPLLMGEVEGKPPEPIAWTYEHKGSRVFYTSLGHPSDFKEESFRRLVTNAISWALKEQEK